MKKFQFSLETLLEVRRSQENITYKGLLEAQMILTKMIFSLEVMQQERNELEKGILEKKDTFSRADAVASQFDYLLFLGNRIQNQKKIIEEAREKMDKQRQELAIVIQKRKMIENLKDRKYAEWDYNLKEKERAFFDELATMRFLKQEAVSEILGKT